MWDHTEYLENYCYCKPTLGILQTYLVQEADVSIG